MLACGNTPLYAEEGEALSLFYEGNVYYSDGNFEEAIHSYEGILDLGRESGALYYNLGNAYFKNGDLGKAILNYLRARRLIPRDADLKSNLDYARSLIKGGVVIPKENWFSRIFLKFTNFFNTDGIVVFGTILYFALSFFIIIAIISRRLKKAFILLSVPLLLFLLLSIFSFRVKFINQVIEKRAVVIAQSAESKFEPLDEATTFFTLNEGESVSVVDSKDEWLKVRRPDDRQGWIKKETVEFLNKL
jgi:tetratricopeptide (TPR) repeat protein